MIEGKNCINYIDGNFKNNNVENFEWCNYLENNRYVFEIGLMYINMVVKFINYLGIEYEFISMSRVGKFLGRSYSYISDKIKNNYKDVIDIYGNKYKFEKLI